MKKQKLYDAITNISDKNITDAKKHKFKHRRVWWISAVACLVVVAICLPMIFGHDPVNKNGGQPTAEFRIVASAATSFDGKWKQMATDSVDNFFADSTKYLLSNAEQNLVYSPLGAYINLAMLAECTDGSSRQQILDALGADDIDTCRRQAISIINTIRYLQSDNAPAASLWIPDNYTYNDETIDRLANEYLVSVFEGDYNSPETLEGMKKWMNDNTGGDLAELVDDFKLMENSDMLLLNSLCYEGEWDIKFPEENTRVGDFHTTDGTVRTEFMNIDDMQVSYGVYDGFIIFTLYFSDANSMVFMLPDEDSSIAKMTESEDFDRVMRDSYSGTDSGKLRLSLPKFDITAKVDLKGMAQSVGIKDVFDGTKADLTALSQDMDDDWIGRFEQMVNIKVNENGARASSITSSEGTYKGEGPTHVLTEIIVDRPFAFVVYNTYAGLPLFSGVVNNPVR